MRIVTKRIVGGLLVGVLALAPLTAYAQPSLDPDVLATVQGAVKDVGRLVQPATAASAGTIADLGPILVPTPTPESVTPPEPVEEPTPEPTEEPIDEPPTGEMAHFDPATAIAYESGPVTLYAPPEWDVMDLGSDDEPSLYISILDNPDVTMVLQDGGSDFPGLAGLVLFPTVADLLVGELGENGVVEMADVTTNSQGLPTARVIFQGEMDGEDGGGAFYVTAAGDTAYLFLAFAPLAVWQEIRADVEAMADAVEIDESAVTLVTADSDDFYYVDDDGTVEVYVPNGWHASGSPLTDLPVIVTDPNYTFAMMMATQTQFMDSIDPEFEALLATPVEDYTPEVIDELTTALLDEITSGGGFNIDETQTQLFDYGDGITLRFVGEGEMDEEVTLPVVVYFDQSSEGIAVALVMGDVDALLADEVPALDVVQSLLSLE